jgi:glycine/D-amino acid oxidase-like deaminating enzyme
LELGSNLKVQWGGGVEWKVPGAPSAQLLTTLHTYQQWGYVAREINESELRGLVPQITPGLVGSSAFYEEEAGLDPVQAVEVLLARARQFGATIEYPVDVTGLDLRDGRIRGVQTASGNIEADMVVLAAGTGTQGLAKLANIDVPLSTSIGILAHTAPQAELIGRVVSAPTAGIKQDWDGRIIASGSLRGSAEGAPVQKGHGDALIQNAAQYLPALKGVTADRVTVGYRVLPKDGYPILGFSEKISNLYIAATHSGITLAPVIGQYAALEIVDGASVDLLSPYRPSRFATPGVS